LSLLPWVGKYAAHLRLAARPFLAEKLPQGGGLPAIGLFVGCGANYLWPEAARASLNLLEAAGVRVVVPPAQVCCGLPAAGAGDAASAAELARRNAAAFEGLSAIVALCASCAYRLRQVPGLPEVRLLPELLTSLTLRPDGRRLRVAYHAPCHVRFETPGQGPLTRLLAALPQVELLPVEEACCGSGGLFGLSHPELSRRILRERLRGLLALRPEVIATDCSGCLIQLKAGLAELGQSIPVVHPAQVVSHHGLVPAR
jgi:glycolate oxidase iron-sulfur subunit